MHTHDQFKVGPDGTGSYRYLIDGKLSADRYHNAESARADARRAQWINQHGLLVPVADA